MCASSNAQIRNHDVSVYMGYYGGAITIGDLVEYDVSQSEGTKDELIACLDKFKKVELTTLIADLIDNAAELEV